MTITARYPGICSKCGRPFKAGDEINWVKGSGSSHAKCQTTSATTAPQRSAERPAPINNEDAPISKTFNVRHRGSGPVPGYTFRSREGQVLTVVRVKCDYRSANWCEDQDDFTFSGDAYYCFTAACREATAEEAAPIIEREGVAQRRQQAEAGLKVIEGQIRKVENHVTDSADYARGESIKLSVISWIVIGDAYIWAVQRTYDDHTEWRIPMDEALAVELRALAAAIK